MAPALRGSDHGNRPRTTALQEPDDEPDEASQHEHGWAEDHPVPEVAFECGDVSSYGYPRLAAKTTTHGGQLAADLSGIVQADIAEDGRQVTAYGAVAFHHYVSAYCGYITGNLSEDVNRTADASDVARLLVGTDANIVAEVGVFGIVFGSCERGDREKKEEYETGMLHK
jgi:hypothetical protein